VALGSQGGQHVPLEESQIQQLVINPVESLSLEMKDWIDPNSNEGKSKIVKAVIAMRNHNGGYLLIGFNNSDGSPNTNTPDNVRELFHVDLIQGLVARYSSEAFEIYVHYPIIDGNEYVIIEAPSGVKSPVATKSGIQDGNTHHIRAHKVIIRSLSSNNTPSTTEAKWSDWPSIMDKCFDNREADVGRFLRRHITGLTGEHLAGLMQSFQTSVISQENDSSIDLLDDSFARFQLLTQERDVDLPNFGTYEVSAIVVGDLNEHSLNTNFLNLLASSNPRYTGWPVWCDSRSFTDTSTRPFVYEGYWEALIVSLERGFGDHVDYWRLSPEGKFYLRRVLQDDLGGGDRTPEPHTALDFSLMILRIAECVIVATQFARALGATESSHVDFAFRWQGLRGRTLSSWSNPNRMLSWSPEAHQDVLTTNISVPIDTAPSAFSGYIQQIINPLFQVFNGFEISESVTEDLVSRLIERRL
jgi:hypothetical protein